MGRAKATHSERLDRIRLFTLRPHILLQSPLISHLDSGRSGSIFEGSSPSLARRLPVWQRIEGEFEPVGILVNNAGNVSLSSGALNETLANWHNVIATQLNAVFLLSKIAGADMTARKRGTIINLRSRYSYFGSGLIPSYNAAKGAALQLTKSMAIELAPHNVQVNAIAPERIETDMTAPVRTPGIQAMNDELITRTAAGLWGQAKEVAGTAVYLASRASQCVTGETIRVDGGYAIR